MIDLKRPLRVPFLTPQELCGLVNNIEATGRNAGLCRFQELAGITLGLRSYERLAFDEETGRRRKNTILFAQEYVWKITYQDYDFRDTRAPNPLHIWDVEDRATFAGDIEQFKKDMSLIRLFNAIETLNWSQAG